MASNELILWFFAIILIIGLCCAAILAVFWVCIGAIGVWPLTLISAVIGVLFGGWLGMLVGVALSGCIGLFIAYAQGAFA